MNTEKTIKEIMENSDLYGLCENCGAIQLRKTFVQGIYEYILNFPIFQLPTSKLAKKFLIIHKHLLS